MDDTKKAVNDPAGAESELNAGLGAWIVDGTLVHPLEAYRDSDDWLASFEALFPERKKKMRAYSKRQGWREPMHRMAWKQVLIPWLNKVSPNVE